MRSLASVMETGPLDIETAVGIVIESCSVWPNADPRGGLAPHRILVADDGRVVIGGTDLVAQSPRTFAYLSPEFGNEDHARRRGIPPARVEKPPLGRLLRFRIPFLAKQVWYPINNVLFPVGLVGSIRNAVVIRPKPVGIDWPLAAVFSFGAMLWEMLAGKPLFKGSDDFQTMTLAREAKVPPLPDAPPELEAIVRRALAREPDDRYQTPGEFADALADYLVTRTNTPKN